jgi:DNA-binding CsgD family transcriptional regulator
LSEFLECSHILARFGTARPVRVAVGPHELSSPSANPKILLCFLQGEALANCLLLILSRCEFKKIVIAEALMINIEEVKITPRDGQVLKLLVQGCSNKEIADQLNISPRTVKQHLRTLFLRAGIRDGRKRVKLATAIFLKEQVTCNHAIS